MKGRILIIDDEAEVVGQLSDILTEFGYEASTIPEHELLLMALSEHPTDLIIMDVNMPNTDGMSLLMALKSSPRFREIPVIMMTSHPQEDTLSECFELGADDFIFKPFVRNIIKARVKLVLNNSRLWKELKRKNREIEDQNKEIIESIKYGQTIQEALYHSREKILSILPHSCLFFRPKQVVSGDFYWVEEVDGRIFVAVADCTGHGVPGAFMSMLGYSLMNQLVLNDHYTDPGQILGLLHENIRQSLKQDTSKSNDGMDIGLCVVDRAAGELLFAGAYNQLVVVNGTEINTLSGDKFPVGGMHHRFKSERSFSTQRLPLLPDHAYYLYTDGFPDQFGGDNGRKFMKKYLHDLLAEIHSRPFAEQEAMLEKQLLDWRGTHAQIDDVLVFGFSAQ